MEKLAYVVARLQQEPKNWLSAWMADIPHDHFASRCVRAVQYYLGLLAGRQVSHFSQPTCLRLHVCCTLVCRLTALGLNGCCWMCVRLGLQPQMAFSSCGKEKLQILGFEGDSRPQ